MIRTTSTRRHEHPDARGGQAGRRRGLRAGPPTDIGYGLLATAIASGLTHHPRGSAQRLTALKTWVAPKWNGLLYNFYHAPRDRHSRFVSTVDNGNLAAALTTVGNLFEEARGPAHRLRDDMDFGLLYDPEKKLLHNGFSPDTGELS